MNQLRQFIAGISVGAAIVLTTMVIAFWIERWKAPRKPRGLVCDDELLVKGTDSLIVAAVLPKLQTLGPGREIVIRNEAGIIMFPEVRETK